MTERRMTKRRKVLNVEFERRKTERRKIFHTIYEVFLISVDIPQVRSNWGDDDWT